MKFNDISLLLHLIYEYVYCNINFVSVPAFLSVFGFDALAVYSKAVGINSPGGGVAAAGTSYLGAFGNHKHPFLPFL